MKQEQFNQENQQIGQLPEVFLKSKATENTSTISAHLDEDSLSAFVDGALTERESEPVMRHLVGCSPCRKITAQLARLAEDLNELPVAAMPVAEAQPSRLQQFLQRLGLTSFGLADESVFAHGESSEDENQAEGEEHQNSEAENDSDSNK